LINFREKGYKNIYNERYNIQTLKLNFMWKIRNRTIYSDLDKDSDPSKSYRFGFGSGMGTLVTGPEDRFHWQRGSGATANTLTGPPMDHTTFSEEGHYLYIDSSYAGPDTFAELGKLEGCLSPSRGSPSCKLYL